MHLEKEFDIRRAREDAVEIALRDETLGGLFPETRTEIVERKGDRRILRSHYPALGHQGVATLPFAALLDGSVRFEKICDGKVWRELKGEVSFEERSGGTRVRIELSGRTKPLVPEFTIKGAMHDQIEQMATALRVCIEAG